MEMSDALEAFDEASLNNEFGELETRQLLPNIEEREPMLPGLRSLLKRELRSLRSSPKVDRVGESVPHGGCVVCSSFVLKNGSESSNESDLGRGIAPLTLVASTLKLARAVTRKSVASFKAPSTLRVKLSNKRSWVISVASAGSGISKTERLTSYRSFIG